MVVLMVPHATTVVHTSMVHIVPQFAIPRLHAAEMERVMTRGNACVFLALQSPHVTIANLTCMVVDVTNLALQL